MVSSLGHFYSRVNSAILGTPSPSFALRFSHSTIYCPYAYIRASLLGLLYCFLYQIHFLYLVWAMKERVLRYTVGSEAFNQAMG